MDSGYGPPDTLGHPAGAVTAGALLGGRYRLNARIGSGGMASIFRARDERLDRDVAVKILHTHLSDDEDLQTRFRTEARHAASLGHPNIVNVYDQGVDDVPYIVMELVEGPSLRDVLRQRQVLSPSETLAVVEPVCRALARAHTAGVVHRDIKPENVLIAADGTPKVADFGIARALADTGHTKTGTFLGSVHYVAPELVDGLEASAASDQYAVGVLLFELLTGRKPLDAETPMAIALRHAKDSVPAPSSLVPGLAPALDAVVRRATNPDPTRRYDDITALADALRTAVPGGPSPVLVSTANDDGREHTLIIPPAAASTVVVQPEPARRRLPRLRRKAGARRLPRLRRKTAPHRRPSRRVLAALLVMGLVAAGAYGAWATVLAPPTSVPPVLGLSLAAATEQLDATGLDITEGDPVHDRSAPAGTVLAQDPEAGSSLRRGQAVTVTLSLGPATVGMPNVVGMTRELAERELGGHAFDVKVHEAFHDTAPVGQVIGQRPEPETDITETSEVIIQVSLGIEQVTVPDLSDMSREEAELALSEAKLTVSFTEAWSDEVPERGQIVSQSIESGAQVDKNTTVDVVVSKGPVTFPMPRVEGKSLAEGRALLQAEDLVVNVIEQPRPRVGPFRHGSYNQVEYQEPQPGETVRRGDTVDVYTFTKAAEERES